MFISNSDLNLLKEKIKCNKSNIERLILHEPNSPNIQLMCIAFKNGNVFQSIFCGMVLDIMLFDSMMFE